MQSAGRNKEPCRRKMADRHAKPVPAPDDKKCLLLDSKPWRGGRPGINTFVMSFVFVNLGFT